jgi:hypothetical protein
MDFREALSKYTSPERSEIYTNESPLYIVATIEAMQTKTGEDFSFGLIGNEIVCPFFQFKSASFLVPPGKTILGKPSNGAEVWINVSTQVVDRAWVG